MLSLPWTGLDSSAGIKATTSVSRYDRDQAEIAARSKNKPKSKGPKRGRE
jgi:hypothetical protein